MACFGASDHLRRKIDTYSAGGFERGQEIPFATSEFDNSSARRHKELIYARKLVVIVQARFSALIGIPIADAFLPVINCLVTASKIATHRIGKLLRRVRTSRTLEQPSCRWKTRFVGKS